MEVILGGARSGKTYKIVEQMKLAKEDGVDVKLVVPTERERAQVIQTYKLDTDDVVLFSTHSHFLRGLLRSTVPFHEQYLGKFIDDKEAE